MFSRFAVRAEVYHPMMKITTDVRYNRTGCWVCPYMKMPRVQVIAYARGIVWNSFTLLLI